MLRQANFLRRFDAELVELEAVQTKVDAAQSARAALARARKKPFVAFAHVTDLSRPGASFPRRARFSFGKGLHMDSIYTMREGKEDFLDPERTSSVRQLRTMDYFGGRSPRFCTSNAAVHNCIAAPYAKAETADMLLEYQPEITFTQLASTLPRHLEQTDDEASERETVSSYTDEPLPPIQPQRPSAAFASTTPQSAWLVQLQKSATTSAGPGSYDPSDAPRPNSERVPSFKRQGERWSENGQLKGSFRGSYLHA